MEIKVGLKLEDKVLVTVWREIDADLTFIPLHRLQEEIRAIENALLDALMMERAKMQLAFYNPPK